MRKSVLSVLCVVAVVMGVQAQQDAMFTKYMFNSLVFNPGYAGSKEYMSMGLLHRTQWWGIDGAPNTQSFTLHSPLRMESVGVGLSVFNDQIGPVNTIGAYGSYAYRIRIGSGKLSIGLQGGVTNWRADWNKVEALDPGDPSFMEQGPSYWLPNFGVGLYYYSKHFFIGASVPHLIEYDLRREEMNTEMYAKQYRHYFFMTGGAIPLNGDALVFRPILLIKNVGLFNNFRDSEDPYSQVGAPTEFDLDLSLFFFQTLWVGSSFRSAIEQFTNQSSSFDSVDIWAAYHLRNGLRVGAAYDYTLTQLQGPAQGSFEVMLGYDFTYRDKQIVTPRYF